MIRRGTLSDIPFIMEMVAETIQIMKEEQNDQWSEVYPTHDIFEKDVEEGSLYVIEEDKTTIGSITIDQNEAEEYRGIQWRNRQGKAFVFHRLVVKPHLRKKGIASRLISFAEQTAREHGVYYMKIDTYSLNEKAQRTFEKNGYQKVGEMEFHGKSHPFYCYDKFL
ncbi:MAG TPA: GNAT family N-acetyltransferase [Bacillus sp. (in: firmicutes)]|nr:GNAT family N-acetyltransferase [Bacillus sp. (in: firmicutes)]